MFNKDTHGAFLQILRDLAEHGVECSPRGLKVKELRNYSYTLPPRVRFMCFNHRKLKLDYIKQELLWYLRGDRRDISIKHVAKMWDGLINIDGTINSNYGYYLFNAEAGDGKRSNFERVINELRADPDSRRAVICILGNEHLNSVTKDYPCTGYLNFHIRDEHLHMSVRMRSQDAIFGMGNDAPCFSLVHELLWCELRAFMPFLKLGDYHHSADSFHVYERHYQMLANILADPVVTVDHHDACPKMDGPLLYNELKTASYYAGKESLENLTLWPFTRWLLTRDDPSTLVPMETA